MSERGAGVGVDEEEVFRMPLGGAAGLDVEDEVDEISSMSGFEGSARRAVESEDEMGSAGMRAVRGLSLPLEVMLGVPICRDRSRPY